MAQAVPAVVPLVVSTLTSGISLIGGLQGIVMTLTGTDTFKINLTSQVARDARWTDRQLTITAKTLGAVRIGMTLEQAQAAAGVKFDGSGDGASYPSTLPAGYPHLYVDGETVECVGAQGDSAVQKVSTAAGFRLGDTVRQLLVKYGSRARYVQARPDGGGLTNYAGYVVSDNGGNLVFMLDPTGRTVVGIAGGGPDIGPNSCPG